MDRFLVLALIVFVLDLTVSSVSATIKPNPLFQLTRRDGHRQKRRMTINFGRAQPEQPAEGRQAAGFSRQIDLSIRLKGAPGAAKTSSILRRSVSIAVKENLS